MAIALRAIGAYATTAATSLAVSLPAGVQTGDVLVTVLVVGNSTAPTAPAGWTLILGGTGTTGAYGYSYYKVAGGSEPGSYTWTTLGTSGKVAEMMAFTGVNNASVLAGTGTKRANSSGSNGTTSMTTDGNNALVIGVSYDDGYTYHNTWRLNGTDVMTLLFETTAFAQGKALAFASYSKATAGATGALSYVFTTNCPNASHLFALREDIPNSAALSATGSLTVSGTVTSPPITTRAVGAYASTSAGTSLAVNLPAGVQTGDVLVAFLQSIDNISPTPPAGWTLILGGTGTPSSTSFGYSYYKVAGGSEPGSYTWTTLGGNSKIAVMAAFVGVDNSDVLAGTGTARGNQSAAVGTTSMTTDADNTLVIGVSYDAGYSFHQSWLLGGTDVMNLGFETTSFVYGIGLGFARYNKGAAGATGALSYTLTTYQQNIGHLFALKPAGTIITGAADLTGTGSLAVSGAVTTPVEGTASLGGAGVLTATGTVTVFGAADLTGVGAVTVSGTVIPPVLGDAALTGTGSLAVSGIVTRDGTASFTGVGSIEATGVVIKSADATLTGSGSLTATGVVTKSGAAALSGSGILTATGELLAGIWGSAILSGFGSLSASGSITGTTGSAVLAGVGALSATGQYESVGLVHLTGEGTIITVGTVTADPQRVQQERKEYIAYLRLMKELLGR